MNTVKTWPLERSSEEGDTK